MRLSLNNKTKRNPGLIVKDFKPHRPTVAIRTPTGDIIHLNISGYPKMKVIDLVNDDQFIKKVSEFGTLEEIYSDVLDLYTGSKTKGIKVFCTAAEINETVHEHVHVLLTFLKDGNHWFAPLTDIKKATAAQEEVKQMLTGGLRVGRMMVLKAIYK